MKMGLRMFTLLVVFTSPLWVFAQSASEPECTQHVGYNLNTDLPGFFCDDPSGVVCVPLTPTLQRPRKNVPGDFYVGKDLLTQNSKRSGWSANSIPSAQNRCRPSSNTAWGSASPISEHGDGV